MASFNNDDDDDDYHITIPTIQSDNDGYTDLVPYFLHNRPVLLAFPASTVVDMNTFFRRIISVNRGVHDDGAPIHVSVEQCAPAGEVVCGYAQPRHATTLDAFLREAADAVGAGAPGSGYLKDWHIDRLIAAHVPTSYFTIPDAFQDDWLNWYWQHVRGAEDDYSFAYVGGHATNTLVHHDVACSYSWSVNVAGTKKWTLWPPRAAHALMRRPDTAPDAATGSSDEFDEEAGGLGLMSDARADERARCGAVEVLQGVGQAIFVPSGWYHQVENVVESTKGAQGATLAHSPIESNLPASLVISLNRNWFNGFNLNEVWLFLVRELTAVRRELWHLRSGSDTADADPSLQMGLGDWYRQCDAILKGNAATNAREFVELLAARVCMMIGTAHALGAAAGNVAPAAASVAAWADVLCPRYVPSTPSRPADVLLSRAQLHALGALPAAARPPPVYLPRRHYAV